MTTDVPCGLLIGRWNTLHAGHDWLVNQVIGKGLRPVLAIRNTPVTADDPVPVVQRYRNIHERYGDSVDIIIIPDIVGVYYGRDVGYEVEELQPPTKVAAISGSAIRAQDQNEETAD